MVKKPRKSKKKKSTFLEDPLQSIALHIGKIVDNSSVKDVAEVGILGLIGYEGYKLWGTSGLLSGIVGFKLATAPSEIAAASGVITLATMGLTAAVPSIAEWLEEHGLAESGVVEKYMKEHYGLDPSDYTILGSHGFLEGCSWPEGVSPGQGRLINIPAAIGGWCVYTPTVGSPGGAG